MILQQIYSGNYVLNLIGIACFIEDITKNILFFSRTQCIMYMVPTAYIHSALVISVLGHYAL